MNAMILDSVAVDCHIDFLLTLLACNSWHRRRCARLHAIGRCSLPIFSRIFASEPKASSLLGDGATMTELCPCCGKYRCE